LDAGDAEYVECIHTNGIGWVTGVAGIGHPICKANFYPNGGNFFNLYIKLLIDSKVLFQFTIGGGQPGCWSKT
jgi:hypothetical protein